MWRCQECGRRFKTTRAAERAVEEGCPGCGGTDIDLDAGKPADTEESYDATRRKTGDDPEPPTAA
jgi:predicted  nucleic acid-binding Zn-ribbon protein